jgi:hypothetical protein
MTTLTQEASTKTELVTKCKTCAHLTKYLTDPDFCDNLNPVTVQVAIGGGHHRCVVTACSGYQPSAEATEG